jgi:hypothetical protein
MNEHRSPALAKAIRRHENAITRRYIAGVQDTKAGQPSRSDVIPIPTA